MKVNPMQSNQYRENVFTGNKSFLSNAIDKHLKLKEQRDELHEHFIVKCVQDVEHLIPEDVRNHPRFGLMTEDELKQKVQESYQRTEEMNKIFQTQYLGQWVENDNE